MHKRVYCLLNAFVCLKLLKQPLQSHVLVVRDEIRLVIAG
uniref:Uncharacterized protein n=1 Tax=Anguilla anguilla TaxID=7936 RepID=A0A0E9QZ23_ANGAN